MSLWDFRGLALRKNAERREGVLRRFRLEQLETRSLLAGLVQSGDLNYLGAFNVPQGDLGASTFEYGGTAIAYNPHQNSLLMVGHDWDQAVAEISIPSLGSGAVTQLPTAQLMQPFAKVLGRVPEKSLDASEGVKVGGLMVDGDRIVGTAFEYYDGAGNAVDSHFTLSSLNLATAQVTGLHQVGELGGGFVGGYMAEVPTEWQDEVGAPYLTGQAALSIISRTSAGPAVFGFDPSDLGATTAAVEPLVYYPLEHPLADVESQNPLFNTTTQIRGVVMPEGTDSVLFIGSHGVGDWWYGDDSGDAFRHDQGPHAPPYIYQVWAYDIHDLLDVRQGLLQPWEVQPYDTWQLDLPYADGANEIGGVAYDSVSGQLFVSQLHGNEAYPVVHAFDLNTPAPPDEPDLPDTNHAPSLDTARAVALAPIQEEQRTSMGTAVEALLLGVTDQDAQAMAGLAVTGVTGSESGVWQYSLNGGSSWNALNTPTDVAARLLAANGKTRLRFVPNADFSGEVAVQFRAWDQTQGVAGGSFDLSISQLGGTSAFSDAATLATLNVLGVNDAPRLNTSLLTALDVIEEDNVAAVGTAIESLVAGVTDADAASLPGIAITAATGARYGAWQYTLDGGLTWDALGAPTAGSARLLPADGQSRVRFVPNNNYTGQVTLSFRAWDQTQGTAGETFDLSQTISRGGATAFSTAVESAAQVIAPVNDAPVLGGISGNIGYTRGSPAVALASAAAVTDIDSANFSGGILTVEIVSGSEAANRLEIGGTTFQVIGSDIFKSGVLIGTITSDGVGSNKLEIVFTDNATKAIVQQLVRSIRFRTIGDSSLEIRTVAFTVSDGDGATSATLTKTVSVR